MLWLPITALAICLAAIAICRPTRRPSRWDDDPWTRHQPHVQQRLATRAAERARRARQPWEKDRHDQ